MLSRGLEQQLVDATISCFSITQKCIIFHTTYRKSSIKLQGGYLISGLYKGVGELIRGGGGVIREGGLFQIINF